MEKMPTVLLVLISFSITTITLSSTAFFLLGSDRIEQKGTNQGGAEGDDQVEQRLEETSANTTTTSPKTTSAAVITANTTTRTTTTTSISSCNTAIV